MEENSPSTLLEGKITGVSFSLATTQEICLSSISDCPISHASQLSNPFLGLPLEVGKCEACGAAEPGKCEGHFGYIELPVPIYHPAHITELKRILSLICLKCLKYKNKRPQAKNIGVLERAFASCCEDAAQVTVNEAKTADGACYLELKVPSRSRREAIWDFLDRYGYHYGDGIARPLLPSEVLIILKKIPDATKKKLAGRGCFFQEGYIMQHLPVPPNCLSTPDVSDGINVMSSDNSMSMLKKVLRQVEIIKSSRSGHPNFESLEVEVNDLQAAVAQYLQSRGAKTSPDRNTRYGIAKEQSDSSSTKAWLEKMKTLFISKGSGFSSRSVITGDPYKGVGEIGIPFEIAQRITFEERVTEYNMKFLQKLVDHKLCLTYRDGQSTYSLREGSKGHTFLKPGQVVHRKIMEGDVIFINRPPTTHKHSLQALSVYIHEDHTFKINPLICGPLSADFDGDCIHIFYPQSPDAKAEVLELFAVEKQLLSSHSGHVNLQLGTDSVLSLKTLFNKFFFTKAEVQQLSLHSSSALPKPSLLKVHDSGPVWTVLELLETSLPRGFDCNGDKIVIRDSKILKLDYSRESIQSIINEIIGSIFFTKGPDEVLRLFNSLQPLLMENLSKEGFNISLEDFIIPRHVLNNVDLELGDLSSLLRHLRKNYNEVIALQVDKRLRLVKNPISDFILRYSSMGNLIDAKSDSAVTKIVQQIGFLGLQILEKGRLYSRTLAEDLSAHFLGKYPFPDDYPYEEFGLVRNGLFHGLDPYQEMVHSICNREQMVRSSRGLTEPGTLFKNSMAILRDVVICYDGTVRNVCSNSIIQFEYGGLTHNFFAAGEPVGVLAATAMSNPAYKAVLDSSPNSNSSWDNMKEILFCGVNFKNVLNDRRVVLYLNACDCGGKYCLENAAYLVKNHLTKVSLKDVALEFLIEYDRKQVTVDNAIDAGLVGHVHLNKALLEQSKISMEEILTKCEDTLNSFRKKKKVGQLFKKIALDCSECSFNQSSKSNWTPCLKFFWQDTPDIHLENTARIFADTFCPVLLNAIIKGDPRVKEANITWISPETTGWIGNPSKEQKGELAINVVLEKEAVKKNGDAWRTVMDSCLPIIHLIDTTRSIPYAIKQVENLLGIACTFEQAIQRLSTSVSMVTKGMLKEHLLLLASSMTCAGILVGFNQAGIKALSKALNFQAPFSEATVYTPKKCFEKAAEKCHADSLSSIVGACSWGKPVAVGTGSRFDILWDTREVELNQKDGIDVYNFLNLVRGVSEEEADNECLGGELDSFDLEDNYMETGSPEIESGSAKPVFEDGLDLNIDEMDVDRTGGKSTWETGPISEDGGGWGGAVKTSATNEGGWGEAAKSDKDQQETGSWGGWGANKSQEDVTEPSESWGKKKDDVAAAAHVSGWGAKKPDTDTSTEKGSSWGQKVSKADEVGWGSKKSDDAKRGLGLGSGSWGQKVVSENEAGWGAKKSEIETVKGSGSGSWGQKADEAGWGSKKSDDTERALGLGSGSWGQKVVGGNEAGWGAKKSVTENEKGSGSGSWGQKAAGGNDGGAKRSENEAGWGAKIPDNETEKGSESGSWGGQKAASKNESGWGVKRSETEAGWGAKKPENETEKGSRSGSWGQKVVKPSQPQAEIANDSDQWGSKESWKAQTGSSTAWGKRAEDKPDAPTWNQGQKTVEKVQPWASWGKKDDTAAAQVEDSSQWGKKDSRKEDVGSSASSWGKPADAPSWNTGAKLQVDVPSSDEPHKPEGSDWSKKVEEKTESKGGWGDSWGKKKEDQTGTTQGANDETTDKGSNWGWNRKEEQKQDQGGWKKKEGWGPKRDRPFRPVGGPNDGPRPGGPFTATGQRIDMFTADEQEILAAVEPIALSIRRIMNGYNDGDPLSADDQTYILDNVFCYHPFKAQKMGAGVKHFMVNKHTKFQESRCLFVVSTDDREEDFSYRKCLENFVKAKFPDKVDEFWPKYLKKSQPRPSINRDNRVSGPDEGGTPRSQSGWKRDTNDESGTPRSQSGWKRDTNDESGTPRSQSGWKRDTNDESSTPRSQSGWNCESSVATDETGPPAATGWNKESSTAPEVGGAPATGWNQVGSSSGAAAEGGNSKSGWGS
ncbi:nuclear RNA polymerase D1B [Artemisia annua]|uniref:DNA-directed RNA polymerase subunit n=1 Tax=Artemisia annua TaxID=35608 RepID=A0A2U1NKC4_ARTAN|nr:nuclear RNA polymerase D1B [Artemisia annua]